MECSIRIKCEAKRDGLDRFWEAFWDDSSREYSPFHSNHATRPNVGQQLALKAHLCVSVSWARIKSRSLSFLIKHAIIYFFFQPRERGGEEKREAGE